MDASIKRILTVFLTIVGVHSFAPRVQAGELKQVVAHATGQIVSQVPCGATEVCQQAIVSGSATRLGAITGVLLEKVDLATGRYTGSAEFTVVTSGDKIFTEYVGQVSPPSQSGGVVFVENHTVVGGTGRFAGVRGFLYVLGSASATGAIVIDGVGAINR